MIQFAIEPSLAVEGLVKLKAVVGKLWCRINYFVCTMCVQCPFAQNVLHTLFTQCTKHVHCSMRGLHDVYNVCDCFGTLLFRCCFYRYSFRKSFSSCFVSTDNSMVMMIPQRNFCTLSWGRLKSKIEKGWHCKSFKGTSHITTL